MLLRNESEIKRKRRIPSQLNDELNAKQSKCGTKKCNREIEKNNEVLSEKLLIVDCMLISCLFVIRTRSLTRSLPFFDHSLFTRWSERFHKITNQSLSIFFHRFFSAMYASIWTWRMYRSLTGEGALKHKKKTKCYVLSSENHKRIELQHNNRAQAAHKYTMNDQREKTNWTSKNSMLLSW